MATTPIEMHSIEALRAMDLSDKKVEWLRSQIRGLLRDGAVQIHVRMPGSWIGSASKEQCIKLITTGEYKPYTKTEPASSSGIDVGQIKKILEAIGIDGFDAEKAREIAQEVFEEMADSLKSEPTTVVVSNPAKGTTVNVGEQHELFPDLLRVVSCGLNAWLAGPAGSGKTHAGEAVAKALELPFYPHSFGRDSTATSLVGFINAQGNYVETPFYRAFKYGGVFLGDEMDTCGPGVATTINAALSNGCMGFPCGTVERHPDFRMIAGANTIGTGASRMYVGRQQQDEASRDRWIYIYWTYDLNLERKLAGNDAWVNHVLNIRNAVEKLNIRAVVSPRASINGAKLLAAGFSQDEVEDMVLYNKFDFDSAQRVREYIKANKGGVVA